jgi:Ca-activated chloride channel family protein
MSFKEPLFLLGLLLVPLVVLAYLQHDRVRRAASRAFVATPQLAAVAPQRPGWRRHVPLAIYGIAIIALVIAMARPQATVAVPVERASIMLATDYSGSMQATDVRPTRLLAARAAADRFLGEVPAKIRVGLVAFNHNARTLATPTTDRETVRLALRSLRPAGATATGEAIAASLGAIERQVGQDGKRPPGAIVLLSDGASDRGRDPIDLAQRARRLGVPIYTVALGTPTGTIRVVTPSGATRIERVPPDAAALRQIAQISRGRAFAAGDAESLRAVYDELGSRVAHRDEQREITAAFAGGALLLLAAGAVMSLHWFRRVP